MFQDNQYTILPANNGRSLAYNKNKHIKNSYFLITDKVHQEDLEIRYNPSGDIMDYYQSKPHQGNLFCTMRYLLMNLPVDYGDNKE